MIGGLAYRLPHNLMIDGGIFSHRHNDVKPAFFDLISLLVQLPVKPSDGLGQLGGQ